MAGDEPWKAISSQGRGEIRAIGDQPAGGTRTYFPTKGSLWLFTPVQP